MLPPVIGALVVRHAGDAAFYWSQLDWTLQSPTVGYERLHHFNRLLEAHLDGLEVAGTTGWKISVDALECWQKPGEAFVCASLALRSLDSDRLEEFLAWVCRRPDQLGRGAVSALAACAPQPFMEIARRWSAIDAPPSAQVIVLRAVALRGRGNAPHLAETLQTYLQSEKSDIRAAACRTCRSTAQANEIIPALQNAVSDPDLQVRAEAAIALASLDRHTRRIPHYIKVFLRKQASTVVQAALCARRPAAACNAGHANLPGLRRLVTPMPAKFWYSFHPAAPSRSRYGMATWLTCPSSSIS